MNLKQIGLFIAELRKKNNLTQAALGEQVGVTDKAVSKWENGQSLPDISIINHLSEILGVTPTELLNGNYITEDNQEDINEVTENSIKFYKENLRKKLMRIIIALFIIIFVLTSIILAIFMANNYNTCQIYSISSQDKQFEVSGVLNITNKKKVLIISGIKYSGTDITNIYTIDYKIIQDNYIYHKKGDIKKFTFDNDSQLKDINEFLSKINIYLEDLNNEWNLNKNRDIRIDFNYIDSSKNLFKISIPIKLNREFSNTKFIY